MPDDNYHGSAGAVTFQAWDQTTGTHGQTGDASVNGGTTAFSTAVETATLTVISVNDKPVLDLNGSGGGTGFAATFTEDGGPVTIVDTDLSVDDADNNNLASATITLTNPLDGLAETLAVNTGSTNISANYNSTSGILSLTGSDTLLNYQTVLRTLAYNNISQNPTVIGRIVEIVVNDSIDNSNLTSTFITVESQNDAPILDTNTTLFVNEGGSGTISVAHLLVTDVDNTDTQLVYTLSSVPAHGQLFRGAVLLGANDTFTQQDINNNSITYTHDASETTSDSFIFTVSDSSGGSIGATTFDISINSSNDTPILVTNAGLSLNEGAGKTITSAFLKVTDTDNTNSELTYHIEIVPTNGIIAVNGVIQGLNGTFTQADINNNRVTYTHDGSETTSDSFTFRVEDGVGGVISSTVFNIAVTPVNDAPIVDLNGTVAAGQDYTGTFVEDGGAVSIVAAELSVTDVDNTNLVSARVSLTNHPNGSAESLSVSTSGTSITANYSSATGILSLSGTDTVAHYQSVLRSLKYNNTSQDPSTVDRVVTIVVNDSLTDSNTATSVVSITAINDLPTLT
ncbi:MAG: cadherin-like domain-containing protein, partial [Anaerolineae bacterium]